MAEFIIPRDIRKMTIELNVRPIIFDKDTFKELLNEPNLHSMAFVVISYRKRGFPKPIQTIHYGLFDSNKSPFFFDGNYVNNNTDKQRIKKLFVDNPERTYSVTEVDLREMIAFDENDNQDCLMCTFYQDMGNPNDPNASARWRIYFKTIDKFRGGGGSGPAGAKVTNPYP
jgi:hypothetical protein